MPGRSVFPFHKGNPIGRWVFRKIPVKFLIKRLNRTTIFISQNGTAIIFEELVPMKKNERLRIIELKNKLHNF